MKTGKVCHGEAESGYSALGDQGKPLGQSDI